MNNKFFAVFTGFAFLLQLAIIFAIGWGVFHFAAKFW
jgi:hypothetical protein